MRRRCFLGAVALAVMAIGFAAPSNASAALLAGWDFSGMTGGGNWGPSPMTPTSSAANGTYVGLTRNWTNGTGTPAFYAWGGNNFAQTPNNTEAGAIAAGNFASLSVTADTGYKVSFSDIPAYNIRHSGTGPLTGQWQYKVDGGSWTDIGGDITWGSNTTSAGNAQAAISLSGISDLQNVAAGTQVGFRVITWGATSTGGTWYLNSSGTQPNSDIDFAINGTITADGGEVPEPASMLVWCGLGCVGLVVGRVRRKKEAAE